MESSAMNELPGAVVRSGVPALGRLPPGIARTREFKTGLGSIARPRPEKKRSIDSR